jgi:alkaline phosphatase D
MNSIFSIPGTVLAMVTAASLAVADDCCPRLTPVAAVHQVSLGQAHQGTLQFDTLLLDSYGRLPQARRTFYLTARAYLTGSASATPTDSAIIQAAQAAALPLISGPMLGDLTEHGITVWFRPVTAEALTVQVRAVAANQTKEYPVEISQAGADTRVELGGLSANTSYTYRIVNRANTVLGEGTFRTAPTAGSKQPVRIAFGSCLHKIGFHNPNLLQLIAQRGNQAMLLLGDLAVDDREAQLNFHHADYLLRDMSQAWRDFAAHIPVYASWDDHDYLNNDKSGLQKGQINDPQRNALRALWQQSWVNPATAVHDRGIYFNAVIGDVEIIMLDTRSCRNWKQRRQRGAYLGDAQMQWLFNTLKASQAKFIILTSGTMWSDSLSRAKDSWGTWDIPGREAIYDFIEANQIAGVLLVSGDRHGARGFRIERPSGTTFHEFEAAALGGVPGPRAFAPDRSLQFYGYTGKVKAFGEFTFEMSGADPEVVFRLISESGEVLEQHRLHYSALTPQ